MQSIFRYKSVRIATGSIYKDWFESQREVFLSVYLSVMIFKIKIIDKINI